MYDYLPTCLYVLVLKVYDGIYSVTFTCQLFVYRALSHYYNSTEISHLTSYPQTSSSNNQEFIAITLIYFFFRDGVNGDGLIQCVVIDNQFGVRT